MKALTAIGLLGALTLAGCGGGGAGGVVPHPGPSIFGVSPQSVVLAVGKTAKVDITGTAPFSFGAFSCPFSGTNVSYRFSGTGVTLTGIVTGPCTVPIYDAAGHGLNMTIIVTQ